MTKEQRLRERLVVQMVLLAAGEDRSKVYPKEEITVVACQFGKHYKVTPDEVEVVLCKSLAAIFCED